MEAFEAKSYNLQNKGKNNELISLIDEAQAEFGADAYMGWAQLMQIMNLQNFLKLIKITQINYWNKGLEKVHYMLKHGLNASEKSGELEIAHTFYQRTYLLFRGYSDSGLWAAKIFSSRKCLQN